MKNRSTIHSSSAYTNLYLSALWSMHGFNMYMKGQWSYEAKILGWMAAKGGAVKLERVHEKESNAIEHLRRVV